MNQHVLSHAAFFKASERAADGDPGEAEACRVKLSPAANSCSCSSSVRANGLGVAMTSFTSR